MKLSIVIPVLNSHEIVRRQLLHFKKMNLPDDVELIIVDDGSDPPLEDDDEAEIVRTNDKRPWTQPKARNIGASHATGETLLFTDIDHIIDRKAIEFGRNFEYDYGRFYRELAILDGNGVLTQKPIELIRLGLPSKKANGSLHISCHTLSMYVKRNIFEKTGGFRERIGKHPTHDDGNMKHKLNKLGLRKCPDDERPIIYMIPNGRFCGDKDANPFLLFHGLKRA